jgi:hypothetical protein
VTSRGKSINLAWRSVIIAFVAGAVLGCGPSGAVTPAPVNAAQASSPAPADPRPSIAAIAGRDLSADEAMGGHTLQRHVGKSDADLRRRLEREPQISSASTFTDRETAESVVGAALRADNRPFASWRERTGKRPNFVLRQDAGRVIGRSIARGRGQSVPCERALIVLRWDERRQRYYVLTSYPEASR